jgi:DNA polymerase I-like protein with 3'-5' exonuclease and polymerase domains
MAFNLKMQGSAGDLLRKLLRDLNANLPRGARVVHQEFDAVVVTCPVDMAVTIEPLLKQTMENVASLCVPLRVKTKHGATLADVS